MKSRGLQPNILTLRALLTASLDQFSRSYHAAGMFLHAGRRNPAGSVFWIRFDERVEKHSCPLDVTNLGLRLEHNAVEIRKVAFGVY